MQGHANLASAFKDAARQDAAIASYRRALVLRPDFPEAFANLVHSLQVSIAAPAAFMQTCFRPPKGRLQSTPYRSDHA